MQSNRDPQFVFCRHCRVKLRFLNNRNKAYYESLAYHLRQRHRDLISDENLQRSQGFRSKKSDRNRLEAWKAEMMQQTSPLFTLATNIAKEGEDRAKLSAQDVVIEEPKKRDDQNINEIWRTVARIKKQGIGAKSTPERKNYQKLPKSAYMNRIQPRPDGGNWSGSNDDRRGTSVNKKMKHQNYDFLLERVAPSILQKIKVETEETETSHPSNRFCGKLLQGPITITLARF